MKKQGIVTHPVEKEQSVEAVSEFAQVLNLADKDFKTALINMFKELKETTFRELKEDMMTLSLQIDKDTSINRASRREPSRNFGVGKYNN